MYCVARNRASALPSSSRVTVASHTWVVRPPCASVASQRRPAPSPAVRTKFVFNSIVVKPTAPSGSDAIEPKPQQVSARVTTVPACRYPLGARNSERTSRRAATRPCSTSSTSRPNTSGSRPSVIRCHSAIVSSAIGGACQELLLDALDGAIEPVHLRHVPQVAQEVLQPLEVVVQAEPPHVDHGNLVVRDGARLRLADASRRYEQVR